jgi:hypothetical protein
MNKMFDIPYIVADTGANRTTITGKIYQKIVASIPEYTRTKSC